MALLDGVINSANAILGNQTLNTIVLAIAIYFLKDFVALVKALRAEVSALHLKMAENYVTKDDMEKRFDIHEGDLHN